MAAPRQIKDSTPFLDKLRRGIEYCLDPLKNPTSQEAYWYAVWNLALEYFFSDIDRFTVSPQWWLLRLAIPQGQDTPKGREARIPDFVVLRSRTEETEGHKFLYLVQNQTPVVIVEIKAPKFLEAIPDAGTFYTWWQMATDDNRIIGFEDMFQDALGQLREQAKYAFEHSEARFVYGIACVGHRWVYMYFDKDLLSGLKPRGSEDSEIVSSEDEFTHARPTGVGDDSTVAFNMKKLDFYELCTVESENSFKKLVTRIKRRLGTP